jgi:hypothetical protein
MYEGFYFAESVILCCSWRNSRSDAQYEVPHRVAVGVETFFKTDAVVHVGVSALSDAMVPKKATPGAPAICCLCLKRGNGGSNIAGAR